MRWFIILFGLMLFFVSIYAEIKVTFISSPVSVRTEQEWVEADVGMALNRNSGVRTLSKGKATIQFDECSYIYINEDTYVKVASLGSEDIFDLLKGKLKVKIKKPRNSKLTIRTPVSIVSSSYAEFIHTSDARLIVLKGKVEFGDLRMSQTVEVMKGQIAHIDENGQITQTRYLTRYEKKLIKKEWKNFE